MKTLEHGLQKGTIEAIKQGISFREASARFGIPKSTLNKKSKHASPNVTTRGVKAVLTPDIENRYGKEKINQFLFQAAYFPI